MANTVPAAPEYPVIGQLQTGEDLDHVELARVSGIVNWAIAHVGVGVVVDQGYHEGEVSITVAASGFCAWRIPIPCPQLEQVRVEVEAAGDGTAPTLTFTSSVDSVVISPTVARGFAIGALDIGPGDYETITLDLDPDDGTLDLYAVQIRFTALSSPLPAQDHGGACPMGLGTYALAQDGLPLSAAMGALLIASLEALRDRPRVLLNHAGVFGSRIRSYDHPEQVPRSVVHAWPGEVVDGVEYTCHVLLEPDTASATWFRLLVEDEVVLELEVDADPAGTPAWHELTFSLPDDRHHLVGELRPALTLGFWAWDDVADAVDLTGTNCGVHSIAVWGP